jgi:FHA domain-containing protein/von Willebrand factor type A domain-containing protein
LLVAVGTMAVAPAARAANVTIMNSEFVDPQPTKDPNKPTQFPTFKVKVGTGATGLKASDFTVKVPEGDKPISIGATQVQAFKDSNEELDLLILVQGSVRFMGNPTPDPDPGETEAQPIPGDYDQVKAAIDVISKIRQKNTKVGLIVYAEKPDIKVQMGDPSAVTGESLGAQKDYAKSATMGLKVGLQTAWQILSNMNGRRVLFVIGNGQDQQDNYNPKDEIEKLESSNIEVYILGADPKTADPRNQARFGKFKRLGDFQWATQAEQIPDVALALGNEINNLYTVEFPGQQSDGQTLPFDGADHEVVVVVRGKEESEPKTVRFKDFRPPPQAAPKSGSLLWLWILLAVVGVGVLVVVALILFKKGGDEEVDEAPQPAVAPPPPMAPPQPAMPQKTMMFGMGGGDDSYPVVGWIVPITGPAAYQTFKLTPGKTVIGNAPDAQVNVSDPYMSTRHAEIIMNPQGFTILDSGSTNGILVNSKRVPQHELVDNDVFTCGKTDFKFKSIN